MAATDTIPPSAERADGEKIKAEIDEALKEFDLGHAIAARMHLHEAGAMIHRLMHGDAV